MHSRWIWANQTNQKRWKSWIIHCAEFFDEKNPYFGQNCFRGRWVRSAAGENTSGKAGYPTSMCLSIRTDGVAASRTWECQKEPGPKLTDRCRWGGFWRITRGLQGKISLPMKTTTSENWCYADLLLTAKGTEDGPFPSHARLLGQ